jgi:hypothetical protein
MVKIENHIVENAILEEVEKLKGLSSVNVDAEINIDCKPGIIGIRSHVLVDITGILEEVLEIIIPNNCYIFRDSDGIRELSIREAAEKLIKIAKHAK